MKDLEPYQPTNTVAPTTSPVTTTDLELWVSRLSQAKLLADALCRTSFAPKAYQGQPEEAAAAILKGATFGLDPIASMAAFDNIHGVIAPKALTLRAILLAAGHDLEVVSSNPTQATVRARRRGGSWQEFVWTIDKARSMGIATKDQWVKQPENMLRNRASADAARFVAPDAVMGIAYLAEELEDMGQVQRPTTVDDLPPRPVAVQAPIVDAVRVVDLTPPDDAPIDPKQWTTINGLFKALDVVGDGSTALRLRVLSELTGRDITRGSDLTYGQAKLIIDMLTGDGQSVIYDILNPAATEEMSTADADHGAQLAEHNVLALSAQYDPTLEPGYGASE